MTFQVSDVSWERLISVLCLMALLWSATPALVAAQANEELQERPGLSRAALLEAARRAAVEDVVEPERATVETGLHRFAQFSGFLADIQDVGRGFHFDGGDFPSGAGFCLWPRLHRPRGGLHLRRRGSSQPGGCQGRCRL